MLLRQGRGRPYQLRSPFLLSAFSRRHIIQNHYYSPILYIWHQRCFAPLFKRWLLLSLRLEIYWYARCESNPPSIPVPPRTHIEVADYESSAGTNGKGSRTRTYNARFWRPLLYHLSYTPIRILYSQSENQCLSSSACISP